MARHLTHAAGPDSRQGVVAIIPARGGSKGLTRKNLRPIGGVPLVTAAVKVALQASEPDVVLVSTDDEEIAAIAAEAGALIVRRPHELATDTASTEAAVLHVLDELSTSVHRMPEIAVFIQCTSPLIVPRDIDATVRLLREQAADCAFTVTPFCGFLWRRSPDGEIESVNHDWRVRPMRQDKTNEFLETGAVYAVRVDGFRRFRHRFFGRMAMHVVPRARSVDVDDQIDLDIADLLRRRIVQRELLELLPEEIDALVMDFDGVLTDNTVWTFSDGTEAVRCSRSDGLGIGQLVAAGVRVLLLSAETNPVVAARGRKLGVETIQGTAHKKRALTDWLATNNISGRAAVYVGNDVNDVGCFEVVGCGVAVADSHPDVLQAATLVLDRAGGAGAVRTICDLITTRLQISQ